MNSEKWKDLESRLSSLEKQNQMLRVGLIILGLITMCIMTLGSSHAGNTVEAQRFVLKNAKGDVRAELTTLDGDYPRLTLLSPNGEKVTELSPAGVSVLDKGLPSKLPLSHFGNTGLYFADEKGQIVIEIGGASVSNPQLAPVPEIAVFDKKGNQTWHVP
ncbi:MAG TPA: hypothetical protein VK699_12570 [Terriglobales bacterium]|jgi:hypothetical protein|nr:hypothetical protein [Terriglobales bacterium]